MVLPASRFPFQVVPEPIVTSEPMMNQTFLAWALLASRSLLG